MVEVIMEAGRKRRLPTWMLGASAAVKPRSSGDEDGKSIVLEEQPETKAAKSKVKPIAGRPDRGTRVPELDGSKRAGTCQINDAKRRTRKANRRTDDPGNSIITDDEAVLPKDKSKKQGGGRHKQAASRKQNQISHGSKNSEAEDISQGSSGDEIELTVEDLMSIAEEYVNADREKQHGRVPNKSTGCSQVLSRCTTTKWGSHPSEIGMKEKEKPTAENSATNIISRCTTTRCSSDLNELGIKKKQSSTTENIATKLITTGDAAQDMLDLFLGPLLKKPQAEQQGLGTTKADSIILVPEPHKQVKKMPEWNEEAFLTKKKSSLKDKVSVFLN